jgi:hypothetical protein
MLRLMACVLTFVAALSSGALAGRDQAAQPTATRIRGRVVTGTGQPVIQAQVRAVELELLSTATGTAETDASGLYEIVGLPAGHYGVSASMSGFAQGGYGQTDALAPGAIVTLGASQTVEGIDVRLLRVGILGGRVTDAPGTPVAGAQVTPLRRTFASGQWHFAPADAQVRAVVSSETGEFTLSNLAPGSYYLAAAGGNRPVNADNTPNRSGYATTLYPGTVKTSEAQAVRMSPGGTVRADIPLVAARLSGIAGKVIGPDGGPLTGGSVGVRPLDGLGGLGAKGVLVRAEGAFLMLGLPPGRYHVQTQAVVPRGVIPEPSAAVVTVGDDNVAGVVLRLVKMVKATGRIIVDPAALPGLQASAIEVGNQPANADGVLGVQQGGRVNDDLTFEFRTWPGPGSVRVLYLVGWAVKAVRLGGADITDTGLEFRDGQDITGLEVELTSHPPVVWGVVTNSQGTAVSSYTVVLFPQDRARWATVSDRYLALGRPDQTGAFTVSSLPPGEYYAVALAHVNRYEWPDPAFLESVRARATSFSIKEGETKALKLEVK